MDVVLVKDFGTLLSLAGKATALERQRAAAGQMLGRHLARAWGWQCAAGSRLQHGLCGSWMRVIPCSCTSPYCTQPHIHVTGAYQKRADQAERRLQEFLKNAGETIDKAGAATKAVFVTFNTQAERAACQAACPKSEQQELQLHRA